MPNRLSFLGAAAMVQGLGLSLAEAGSVRNIIVIDDACQEDAERVIRSHVEAKHIREGQELRRSEFHKAIHDAECAQPQIEAAEAKRARKNAKRTALASAGDTP